MMHFKQRVADIIRVIVLIGFLAFVGMFITDATQSEKPKEEVVAEVITNSIHGYVIAGQKVFGFFKGMPSSKDLEKAQNEAGSDKETDNSQSSDDSSEAEKE